MGLRQSSRLLIGAMILTVLTMLSVGAVSAHARPKTSDPADKATVNKAPTQVIITFSEETNPTKSGGSVTDASGAMVSTGFKVDLNERTKMTIDLKPNLPNGAYTVKWNSFTDDDNGMADGTLSFTIQAAQAASTGSATTGTTPAGASAVAGTAPASPTTAPVATTAPTATTAAAATTAPTATRPATTAVATGTGGGTVATSAPTTLPKTGSGTGGSRTPWIAMLLVAAIIAVAAGVTVRLRMARR